jgi:ATP-dependent RNA helicase SUPV3L1/SUV3
VADVNDKGEVTVEDQMIGRLDGFRFRQDQTSSPDEAKMLRQAALAALTPHFNLRADKFYNAPDTEMDFTEQGGLRWGEMAVGKLVKGASALKPEVEAFVDEEAGADVAEKVKRRLQHFIDRKITAAFEPMMALANDETLTGLAKGFAFQVTEALGVLTRDAVANDVKALEQDARGALRKHGIRFGQFTIFMPLLLKPAPTRLRLVLWSLQKDLAEFPESPPPGLVTVPAIPDAPEGYYTQAGYRLAGERAIRIDMLERLADQLRAENSRGGFEAKADMLSITGMTLEQFANLMTGLGYKAEKGERDKVKAAPAAAPETKTEPAEEVVPAAQAAPTEDVVPAAEADAETPAPEKEVFYTFTWGGFGTRKPREGARPQSDTRGKGKPGGKPKGKGGPRRDNKAQNFQARPPKKEKAIDPDNPFAAALMGLKKD